MESKQFEIESNQHFSKSKIWQINREYYHYKGLSAFREGIVPHHLTSNSLVGKTYAELLFGFLKDLALKGQTKEKLYILELGAGHGRLAFHILMYLEKLTTETELTLPPFCYVLSDIVEENLTFFKSHPQFQDYYQKGILDLSYFDAVESQDLHLQYSEKTIQLQDLGQPMVAIANYFFDSIPSDLFCIKDSVIANSSVAIATIENPTTLNPEELIKSLTLTYSNATFEDAFYENPAWNKILEAYKDLVANTYLFFPAQAMHCISKLKQLSKKGLLLLSMDKGFHEIHDLENKKEPELIRHGSFSIWVNYHALGAYCKLQSGKAMFPANSNFHLELAALLFLEDGASYHHTNEAYEKFVNDFGPDDFNSLKQLSYFNAPRLKLKELIALFRLSGYDSTFFIKLLPRLKQVAQAISFNERKRIAETLHQVWLMYFSIGESYDLAYEIGGVFYDLGFYHEALNYFQYSEKLHGQKPDTFYNVALSYYQLRQDKLFYETIHKAKTAFPKFEQFKNLENLDMN